MAKIYKLMIENEQVNDVYYNEDDAIDNTLQIHSIKAEYEGRIMTYTEMDTKPWGRGA